jgi:hypothetical protein
VQPHTPPRRGQQFFSFPPHAQVVEAAPSQHRIWPTAGPGALSNARCMVFSFSVISARRSRSSEAAARRSATVGVHSIGMRRLALRALAFAALLLPLLGVFRHLSVVLVVLLFRARRTLGLCSGLSRFALADQRAEPSVR